MIWFPPHELCRDLDANVMFRFAFLRVTGERENSLAHIAKDKINYERNDNFDILIRIIDSGIHKKLCINGDAESPLLHNPI